MAKFTATRLIEGNVTLRAEQCSSWDEAFKLIDKGEAEHTLWMANLEKIALEEAEKKEEKKDPEIDSEASGGSTAQPLGDNGVDADGQPNPPAPTPPANDLPGSGRPNSPTQP